MTNEDFADKLFELSFMCGMNQRYAQAMLADSLWHYKIVADIASISSIFTFVLLIISCCCKHESRMRYTVQFISLFSAVCGLMLLITPTKSDAQHYAVMFQAWSDLRQDVDAVITDSESSEEVLEAISPDKQEVVGEIRNVYLQKQYSYLKNKANGINSREPAADKGMLMKAYNEELVSRYGADESEEHKLKDE